MQESGVGEQILSRYTLYETKTRLYITASSAKHHRILKIDRTAPESLCVVEDHMVYDSAQLHTLLRMVDDGNRSTGGLEKILDFHGIIGFVRFSSSFYVILCTKRSVVSLLGGHYIFHCDETLMFRLGTKGDRTAEEARLLSIFQQVDLSKNFYFSYSYDLTNTLQINLTRPASCTSYNTRFMWNHHLLTEAFGVASTATGDMEPPSGRPREEVIIPRSPWILPLIHGSVDQAKIPVLSRTIYTTLIARRSRRHAGTRYLKRGVNEWGDVANEVETEQIVSEPLITSFVASKMIHGFGAPGNYTSYVQLRGSIPLHWTQDITNMSPRPPIEIAVVDPFFGAAARHFCDLLERYGAPIVIVNLIKGKETVARESKLLSAYAECVAYLNQFLPPEANKKLRYIAWDMAQATKTKSQDVIGILEDIAEESIQLTGFFHRSAPHVDRGKLNTPSMKLQQGICRTNCIDCLDRTNAAQFSIGKKVLGHQLHALGVIDSPDLGFDSDVIDMLIEMYHDHGDTLAWQYTGSALVNRMDTYRRTKTRQWSSHSRDLLENVKRYYNNSLLDADKQAAIDLFLGVCADTRTRQQMAAKDYRHWFEPNALVPKTTATLNRNMSVAYDVWRDYYKPHLLSQFQRLYTFSMNSTAKTSTRIPSYTSPFTSRTAKLSRRPARTRSPEESMQHSEQGVPTVCNVQKTELEARELEGIVLQLLAPTLSEAKQEEYEWYIHYQTDEAMASKSAEAEDVDLYIANIQTAREGYDGQRDDLSLYEAYLTNTRASSSPIRERHVPDIC